MASIRKSLAYSISAKYLSRFVNLVSVIFIARMLTPEQLGVFAIASSIVLIASELKSFGADGYLIREKDIDKSTVSQALGVSSAISWSMGIGVFCGSWFLQSFYEQEDLATLIQILAASFFLSPHIGAGKALLARDFKFEKIMIVDITSQVIQFASVVILVFLDFGYFSLVISSLIGYSVEFLLVLLFRTKNFVFIPTYSGNKRIIRFGVFVTAANLFRKMSFALPELIIGKTGTVSDVSYFSRGTGFVSFISMTINSGVQPVIAPYLADKQRNGIALGESYLLGNKMLGGLMIPVLAVAAFTSETVIIGMFGNQWFETVPVVTVLCLAGILRSTTSMSISAFITAGHEKALCYLDLFLFICIAGLVIYLYQFGLVAAAYSFLIVAFLRMVLTQFMMKKFFLVGIKTQILNNVTNFAIAFLCIGLIAGYEKLIGFGSLYQKLAIITILSSIGWYSGLFIFKHPLSKEVISMQQILFSKIKSFIK